MTYVRQPNIFRDPSGTVADYPWYINHTTEEKVQLSRQMANGAPTSDIGLLPQQGVEYPLVFQWHGSLFRQNDKNAMDAWYGLCRAQSIYLIDFDLNEYEILITDWDVQRVPVANNKRGGNIPWMWSYDITIRVLRILSGDYSAMSV